MAPEKRDGIFGLATTYPDDESLVDSPKGTRPGKLYGMKMLRVEEQTGKILKLDSSEDPFTPKAITNEAVEDTPNFIFTADIDGDQILERIDCCSKGRIRILSSRSETPIAEFAIPLTGGSSLSIEQHASKWYLKAIGNPANYAWYELPSGRLALRFDQWLESTTISNKNYPRLIPHSTGTLLVGSTPEAVLCVEVDLENKPIALPKLDSRPVILQSSKSDPRYRKVVIAHGIYDRKTFAEVIRLAILVSGAFLVPLGYVYLLIRRRQWSLSTMMLAPALVMLALICWRPLQASSSGYLVLNILVGGMAALTALAMLTLIQRQRWKILGVSIVISMVVGTLLMFGAHATLSQRSPGMIGYWTLEAWFASVLAAAAQIVMPIAVGSFWGQAKNKKSGSP